MVCANCAALAQSNPNLTYGQVPTAGQWNSYFSAKQDVLGFTPLNSTGGSMAGPLFLLPSAAGGAGVNIGVGVAPSFPNNGDMWETATGLFARINGSSVNISTGGSPAISLPATVSGTVNSGGIPYFTSTTNMASSAALGAGLLVKGGGAGVAPSTFTLGGGCTFATPNLTCAANALTGTTLAAGVVSSSLTSVGALTSGSTAAGFTINLGTSTVSGTLPVANDPALTGDVTKPSGSSTTSLVLTGDATKSAGSSATTVAKIGGTSVGTPTGTAGTAVVLGTNANITTPTIAQGTQNQPTVNQPIIMGDTSAATNAAAGQVGEVLSASATVGSIGSATPTTVTSKSITAGHWMCTGSVTNSATSGSLLTYVDYSVSLTNNSVGSFPARFVSQDSWPATVTEASSFGPILINFTSTTTVYVVARLDFTAQPQAVTATLNCQRIW